MGVEGGRGRLYTYRCTVTDHKNDSCIKMGSDESHFNVLLTVRDKVEAESSRGPFAYRLNVITARPNRLTGKLAHQYSPTALPKRPLKSTHLDSVYLSLNVLSSRLT